jgi:hypothetical protein
MQVELLLFGIIPDKELFKLISRLCFLSGQLSHHAMNYSEHEIVFIPSIETPYGPKRKDDVVLRLLSSFTDSNQAFIPLDKRSWTLVQTSSPLPATHPSHPISRSFLSCQIDDGHVFKFMNRLGYTSSFEIVRQGYSFHIHRIHLTVYVPSQPSESFRVSTGMPLIKDQWICKASLQVSQEHVSEAQEQLKWLSNALAGLVSLKPVDHTLLDYRINYQKH